MRVTTTKKLDPTALAALLGGAMVRLRGDWGREGEETVVEADVPQATLDAVLAAYVWAEPVVEVNERVLDQRAEAAMAGLRTLATGTGTLTSAQLTAALRLCARVLLVLVRLRLRRLDAVD